MKNRVEKPDEEGQTKSRPGTKTSPQVRHPIIQLQQTIGNKAVVCIIQRQETEADDKALFRLEGMPTNNEIQTKLSDKLLGFQGDLDEKWQGGDSNMMPGGDSGLKWQGGDSSVKSGGESDSKWNEEDSSGKW